MKKYASKIIIAIILVIICIPIFSEMAENSKLSVITYDEYEETVANSSSYKLSLIYVASSSDSETSNEKKVIKDIFLNDFDSDLGYKAYYMDLDELSYSELYDLGISDAAYIFAFNGEVLKVLSAADLDDDKLEEYINMYGINYTDEDGGNYIPEDLVNYKVAKDAKTYLSLVKKKQVTVAMFGRNNCYYCNRFLPVLNTVAEEYDLDLYVFDSNTYDSTEYQTIMNSGLTIPAECSDDGEESKLSDGFGTPLTLITKNNKVIDCISGYVNKETLITKLQTVGLID